MGARFCRGIHGHGIPAVWRAEVSASPALVDFPFSGLGAYYLYTLFLGARAVSISSSWIVDACASMYELSGLAGMGPSRLELRMCMTPDALWNMNGLGAGMIFGAILLAGSACGIILWNKRAERPLVPALLVLILLPGAVFLLERK